MFERWHAGGVSENRPFRRDRPTLAERVAASGLGQGGTADAGDAKHCWVVGDPRWPGRRAALLLGWVRDGRGWVGRVALAPGPGAEIVLAHVAAAHLDAER